MEEFDAVAMNAAQLNDIYDTPTTNALVVAVATLRERLERDGAIKMNNAQWLITTQVRFSDRLQQAVSVGMVELQVDDERRSAQIHPPPNAEKMSDDDWLNIIQAASEVRRELESLGFYVKG